MADSRMTVPMAVCRSHGGFRLSDEAVRRIAALKRLPVFELNGFLSVGRSRGQLEDMLPRTDPDLCAVVRELGAEAGKDGNDLRVLDVTVWLEVVSHDGREDVSVHGGLFSA